MADLNALIRLRRFRVEEKQKALAEMYRQIEDVEAQIRNFEETLRRERELLNTNPNVEALAYFGRYADVVRRDIERMGMERKKIEVRIQIAQDDMREAFTDLKRVEIVQRNREEEEKKETQDRETREMNEIGLEVFRRKED